MVQQLAYKQQPVPDIAQQPELVLMNWLQRKPERMASPCIAYLYQTEDQKHHLERLPLEYRMTREAIASEIARRLFQMKQTRLKQQIPSQTFVAVAVYINGVMSCWTGDKSIKLRNFTGNKRAVKQNRGRQALAMLMTAV